MFVGLRWFATHRDVKLQETAFHNVALISFGEWWRELALQIRTTLQNSPILWLALSRLRTFKWSRLELKAFYVCFPPHHVNFRKHLCALFDSCLWNCDANQGIVWIAQVKFYNDPCSGARFLFTTNGMKAKHKLHAYNRRSHNYRHEGLGSSCKVTCV